MGDVPVLSGRRRAGLALAVLASAGAGLAACSVPPLRPSSDTPRPAGVIAGTVTITGTGARGDLLILLFPQPRRADGSCPAAGTSLVEPLNLLRIDEAETFVDPDGDTFSVEFVLPQVPEGCYSIGALVDADADFYPLFGVTAGSTLGDGLGGAFVEPIPDPPASPTLRVLEVAAADGIVPAMEGVQVLVGATVPLERPSFVLEALPAGAPLGMAIDAAGAAFQMTAVPIALPIVQTGDPDGPPCPMGTPLFPIVLGPDLDGDFVPEDLDGDMAPDVYGTRVLLRRLSDDLPADPLPDAPWDEDPDFPLLIPGVIDPTPFVQYHAMVLMTPPDGMTLLAACELTILVPPIGVLPSPLSGEAPTVMPLAAWEAMAEDSSRSPLGSYGVIAILTATNQTWDVPNELMLLAMDPGQAATFELTPP